MSNYIDLSNCGLGRRSTALKMTKNLKKIVVCDKRMIERWKSISQDEDLSFINKEDFSRDPMIFINTHFTGRNEALILGVSVADELQSQTITQLIENPKIKDFVLL